MAKITISGKEYNIRFNLLFWEKVKVKFSITQSNMESLLNDDFGNIASNIIYYGIFCAIPKDERPKTIEEMELTLDDIKEDLDASVMDIIEEAIIESMTKSQREITEQLAKVKKQKIEELVEGKKKE